MDAIEVSVRDKILLKIPEAASLCNVGINRMEEIVRDPRCCFAFQLGNKRLIKREKLEEYIDSHSEF